MLNARVGDDLFPEDRAMEQTPSRKRKARVLIVDAWPAVREALVIRLNEQRDLEVCGEAATLVEALALAAASRPDVAVVGIALKVGDGIDLIKMIKANHQHLAVIVWSMYSEELYGERAFRAGAMGYVSKQEGTATVIKAIRQVLAGDVFRSSATSAASRDAGDGHADPIHSLSDRELEVFRLIGSGLRIRDIATRLHVSTKTVETYRDRIRNKLSVNDANDLMRSALEWTLKCGCGIQSDAWPSRGLIAGKRANGRTRLRSLSQVS
jgi:DNA-binding NarL/FixJ family response regulator